MRKSEKYLVSLIIPAYKQEKTIQKDLLRIKEVMDQLRYPYEIIAVVDGKLDKTFEQAKKVNAKNIIVTGYDVNKGKGYAVRFGMAKAKGNIVGFLDSGMDINPNGLSMLLEHFEWYKADIIVGSKLHPVSKIHYPLARRILSRGYRVFTKLCFGLSVRDTQVGMKFYRRRVLQDVLPRLLVKRYAFDVELLAVAYYLGYKRIYEAPIELEFGSSNTITNKNFWRISFFMLWDTMAVFYRLRLLRYYDNGNHKKWKYDPALNFRINI